MRSNGNCQITFEFVTGGQPGKMADCIPDSVLDAVIGVDPEGWVACEKLVTTFTPSDRRWASPKPGNRWLLQRIKMARVRRREPRMVQTARESPRHALSQEESDEGRDRLRAGLFENARHLDNSAEIIALLDTMRDGQGRGLDAEGRERS